MLVKSIEISSHQVCTHARAASKTSKDVVEKGLGEADIDKSKPFHAAKAPSDSSKAPHHATKERFDATKAPVDISKAPFDTTKDLRDDEAKKPKELPVVAAAGGTGKPIGDDFKAATAGVAHGGEKAKDFGKGQ